LHDPAALAVWTSLCPQWHKGWLADRPKSEEQMPLKNLWNPALPGLMRVPAVAAVVFSAMVLAGCSSISGIFDSSSDSTDTAYVERPVEQIYDDAWKQIRGRNWLDAAKQFDEVERQHPYSIWARRAMLMSAFCYYQANKYDDAINTADQFIQLHPGSTEVAYAFYLKAMSLYEQITDVGRDQTNTEAALTALQDVIQRFPHSEYARDASLKVDLTLDHLAGKEMAVGRYYLHKGDYIGAINRFRVVVERYQKTTQIAEALERLTEAYYALGVYDEAQTAAAVLGANYPGSNWYQDSYKLLTEHNLKPEQNKDSWISRAFTL
jgi:outer membrane protein assembly factor BamD